ncbi:MAG: hypothetical protein LBV74_18150 [Tannerella sp.]|jgi:hypothetical protein|nr:hypothetical protein [Tannerella sp.]
MEFCFEMPDWLEPFMENPMFIVAWAAFGMPLFMMALLFVVHWIFGIVSSELRENILIILATALIITWLAGFILMILMLFGGVHPVKMIICWILLLTVALIFCSVENQLIRKWINNMSEKPFGRKKS